MTVESLKTEIKRLYQRSAYFRNFEVIDETASALKVRLFINRRLYVQIYANLKKKIDNFVLVFNNQRIFGADSDGGRWHKHPWENPASHVFTKEIQLEDFLFEVYSGLRDRKIV